MYPNLYTGGAIKRSVRITLVFLSSVLMLGACIALAHTAAAQTAQASDPAAVVTAFNAAVSRQDATAALAFLDPNFRYVSGPGSALPTDRGKSELLGPPPFQQIVQSNIHPIDATTVEMDLTFSGGPIPSLPHPFMLHATFTVKNGLITHLQDRLSPQTAQDLAALGPPPGAPARMPNTGESNSSALTWLLALGLMCILAGTFVWRIRVHR